MRTNPSICCEVSDFTGRNVFCGYSNGGLVAFERDASIVNEFIRGVAFHTEQFGNLVEGQITQLAENDGALFVGEFSDGAT